MDKKLKRAERLLVRALPYLSDSPDLVQVGAEALAAEIRDLLSPEAPPITEWLPLSRAGQVQPGDSVRFKIGDRRYGERVAAVLYPGTEREEVIYNKRRNFYFITSMAIAGTSSHKGIEFKRVTP